MSMPTGLEQPVGRSARWTSRKPGALTTAAGDQPRGGDLLEDQSQVLGRIGMHDEDERGQHLRAVRPVTASCTSAAAATVAGSTDTVIPCTANAGRWVRTHPNTPPARTSKTPRTARVGPRRSRHHRARHARTRSPAATRRPPCAPPTIRSGGGPSPSGSTTDTPRLRAHWPRNGIYRRKLRQQPLTGTSVRPSRPRTRTT